MYKRFFHKKCLICFLIPVRRTLFPQTSAQHLIYRATQTFSIVLFSSFVFLKTTVAQETVLQRVADYLSPFTNFTPQVFQNPALQYYQHQNGRTELALSAHYKDDKKTRIMQEGEGEQGFQFNAESWNKLNALSRIWGQAFYKNSQTFNICWNETSDFQVVYPYVMADTLGGDLKSEIYSFKGGYAREQRTFLWGAELNYRANMEYRKKDPRPRNIVSDLNGQIGIALKLKENYTLGTSLKARKYKQTNNVKFFSELGVYKVYHMSGLGMDYVRFSGTNNNTYYKGKAYSGSLEVYPRLKHGFSLAITYNHFNFEKILSDLNNLPLNEMTENRISGEISWRHTTRAQGWGIRLTAETAKRKGTENLFGDATSGAYKQIGSAQQYICQQLFSQLLFLYENKRSARFHWSISPYAGYHQIESKYLSPLRRLHSEMLNVGIGLNASHVLKKCLLHFTLKGIRAQSLHSELILKEGSTEKKITEMLSGNYDVLSAHQTSVQGEARFDYSGGLTNKTLFVKAQGRYNRYSNHSESIHLSLALGLVL